MREELSSIRGRLTLAAAVATLLLAAGCGGGSGDTSTVTVGQVTVKTGSLSKDEFVEKADEICKETRKEFQAAYTKFLQEKESKAPSKIVLAEELVDSVAVPHLEREIAQIGELGAPQDYANEVGSYLSALKQRLDEGKQNPVGLIASTNTFKQATSAAEKAGLRGCAASLN
jgi:ABC-type glycerol-3-phosphate transport system substrate-binding protein